MTVDQYEPSLTAFEDDLISLLDNEGVPADINDKIMGLVAEWMKSRVPPDPTPPSEDNPFTEDW